MMAGRAVRPEAKHVRIMVGCDAGFMTMGRVRNHEGDENLASAMRKVVYLLGAGFSAPLGLPVIGNFYWKAKDLYDGNPEVFAHFAQSFSVMESFHRVKMFMNVELENIEEILSILEMKDVLSSEPNRETFSRFICDVIRAYTPKIQLLQPVTKGNDRPAFPDFFGQDNHVLAAYGVFVSQLFGVSSAKRTDDGWTLERGETPVQYSVVSMNYDCVLEMACDWIRREYANDDPGFSFFKPGQLTPRSKGAVMLAKLHGSIDGDIVPPTWNKRIHEHILPAWRAAFTAVAEANEIRFIGYSLPETDSYFRFFLKAAISQSFNLQRVDVLCLGNVGRRYEELFEGKRLRFRPGNTERYLVNLTSQANAIFEFDNAIRPNSLEVSHSNEFRE
jgi:hypothetical protein